MFLLRQHNEFFRLMIKQCVDFLIIGGYAVNFHGYSRMTEDIDLWLRPDNLNRDKFIQVLISLGFSEAGIHKLKSKDFTEVVCFHIGERPERIDFITKISGISFNEAWTAREIMSVDDIQLPFISFNHLILSKISNNRLRDQADVEELQKINRIKRKSGYDSGN